MIGNKRRKWTETQPVHVHLVRHLASSLGHLPDHAPSLLQPQSLRVQNRLPLVHAIAEQQHRRAVRPGR